MRVYALIAFALTFGFLLVADAGQNDAAKKELKKLEGTWVMVSGEAKGEKLPESTVKDAVLSIVGDKHNVKVGKDTIIGTHKLDATAKPRAIDAMDTEGPYKDKTVLGIYKVDKDRFTICFAPPGMERPKEFTTKSGTAEILHVWKRK